HIKEASPERLAQLARPHLIDAGYLTEQEAAEKEEWIAEMMAVLKERISYIEEVKEKAAIFFQDRIAPEDEEAAEVLKLEHLPLLLERFSQKVADAETVDEEFAQKALKEIQKETGYKGKNLYMPIRVVLTGAVHGPDLPLIIKLLGKQKILSRIEYVKNHLIK
ncbi:MAG TPA: glutamate--tRNA ligase, partial [Clostridiales bacterium]|nr:glutamate--tRNA ligase [Clostridiales bacterium]